MSTNILDHIDPLADHILEDTYHGKRVVTDWTPDTDEVWQELGLVRRTVQDYEYTTAESITEISGRGCWTRTPNQYAEDADYWNDITDVLFFPDWRSILLPQSDSPIIATITLYDPATTRDPYPDYLLLDIPGCLGLHLESA